MLSGRSVYYGAFLYLSDFAGHLWPVVFIQSAVVLVAIALTLRSLALFTWSRLAAISLLLDALTSMPFFVSYLMPDIFAAITILAIANLLFLLSRKSYWTALLWTIFLTAALLFHVSHILMAIALLLFFVPVALIFHIKLSRIGVIAIICALTVALAGEFVFNLSVKKMVGESPIRPPLLMARMIGDGPGYRYLLAACPTAGFTVCRFLPRLPIGIDEFVWDTDPDRGVFAASDPATRRSLSNEQYRFAWAVFRFDPFGELAAFLRDTGRQVTRIGYLEFNYDPSAQFFNTHLPPAYFQAMTLTSAWKEDIPAKFLWLVAIITICLALLYIIYLLVVNRSRFMCNRTWVLVFCLCSGIITNAAVCALSDTADRYEARVIWLIPFAAMLLELTYRQPSLPS